MSWNCETRLSAQDYYHQNQRIAFRAGYSDAFHGAPMWAGNDRNWNPDEYRAGFDAGIVDKSMTINGENERTFSLETITAAIYQLRAAYLASGDYESFQAINAGACENFASDIDELIGSPPENSNYRIIDPTFFLQEPLEGDENNWGYPLNREQVQSEWPSVVPPPGLDWDDLDHISAFGNFFSGTHIWIFSSGKHYDAETPEGVDTPFDLPFFKRIINRWIEEGKPEASLVLTSGM